MWRVAEKEMKKHKIPESFSYDPMNIHKGEMPGWPKECNWTDNKAKRVLYACYRSGQLSFAQLRDVRKSLSYLYELKTGGNIEKQKNWAGVKQVWKTFRFTGPTPVRPSENSNVPWIIPSPQDLKTAFTTPWTPKTKMPLMVWCVGSTAAWDWGVCGARSQEDLDRIKKAPRHVLNVKERWCASKYDNGRCKLPLGKSGSRPWWVFRICLCPGQKHISPPKNFFEVIGKDGNPTVPIKWNTNCPIACIQLYMSMLPPREQRVYPKWLKSGRFGKLNYDSPVDLAIDWYEAQGVCTQTNRYDTNAGRKSLARWCRHLNVPYEESFEIHGDLFKTWSEHYEDSVPGDDSMNRREQSRNPDVATRALGRLANWFGRGKQVAPRLNRQERYLHEAMMLMGQGLLAHRIAHGLPTERSFG